MYETPISGQWGEGGFTATAGTIIQFVIPPRKSSFTVVTTLAYISLGTQHTITVMRSLAETTLTADAAAGQAVINLQRDPGLYAANALADNGPVPSVADNAIATNDFVVVEKPDGTFHLGKVSSVSGLAVTLTANVPTGGFKAGAKVWFFGATADTNPKSNLPHAALKPPVSARTLYQESLAGIFGSYGRGEPILFNSDNGTAAGIFDVVSAYYTTKGGFRS
jgi:hypothetical protein